MNQATINMARNKGCLLCSRLHHKMLFWSHMDRHQILKFQVDTLTKAICEALDRMSRLLSFKRVIPPCQALSSHIGVLYRIANWRLDVENIRWHLQPYTPFWQTVSRPLISKAH